MQQVLMNAQSRTTSPCTYVCRNLALANHGFRLYNLDRMDDPILWGILPLSYMFNPDNLRWGLGSYDLCFTNKYVPSDNIATWSTNAIPEDCQHSSPSGRFSLHIDRRILNSAASSSLP
jgi:hypothetical protein